MTRTALVTGASSGFGAALTRAFARAGWNVAATMRKPSQAPPDFASLPAVEVVRLDVTEPESIVTALDAVHARFGPVDVLANVAGYAQRGSLEEMTLDQIRAQFETNLFGALALTKAVLPQMRERAIGHILNFSSVAGTAAVPTMAAYSSSKFALEGFSESLAQDVRHLGINVTIVQPASYKTEFGAGMSGPAHPLPDEYGPAQALLFANDYKFGDLDASCDAVVSIATMDNPPLRLALGHGLHLLRGKLTAQWAEYERWEQVTATTL
ncbi:SDR family oxidoreductase [Streptomyces sp. NPDC002680]|uniref:SDR family oxidoreductase n=1 Tax=Streptomyces sp. NPDC002680 TaxID=3364659 RepID=UPI0036D1DE0F